MIMIKIPKHYIELIINYLTKLDRMLFQQNERLQLLVTYLNKELIGQTYQPLEDILEAEE